MFGTITIKALGEWAKDDILKHLLELDEESKRLRFGIKASNEYITNYVNKINFNSDDKCYGAFDIKLRLIGLVHLAKMNEDSAEIGISVAQDCRKNKIGQSLWQRAVGWARMAGCKYLYSFCLAENEAMIKLAKKENMTIITEYGDSEAKIKLNDPTISMYMEEIMLENIALVDMKVKEHVLEVCKHIKFLTMFMPQIRILCDKG